MAQRDFFAFCRSLRLIELKAIGLLSRVRHYREGDYVYRPGTECDELFIVTRGAVELVAEPARAAAPATMLARGDIFGETGPLMGQQRDHTARACASLSVQVFLGKDFPELLQRVPSFFLFLSEKLANRLYQARELSHLPNTSLELAGSLANFDIVTIYQTIIQSRQTGLLTIADEDGETISTFYFENGSPRWGRFQHLSGEEAFWQLFLHEHRSGSFIFSNETQVRADWGANSAVTGKADEILINAIRMRDQFDHLRKRIHEGAERMHRKRPKLIWENPDLQDLRSVAEEIWHLSFTEKLTLAELHERSEFCDWKIYRTVDELIRTGLFTLTAEEEQLQLVGAS